MSIFLIFIPAALLAYLTERPAKPKPPKYKPYRKRRVHTFG